jgi:hypothetical protein
MSFIHGIENFFSTAVQSVEDLFSPNQNNAAKPATTPSPQTSSTAINKNASIQTQEALSNAVQNALGAPEPETNTQVRSAVSTQNQAGGQVSPKAVVQDGPSVVNPSTSFQGPVYHKDGYPPIYGGTQEQANEIWGYMANMPPEDRQAVHAIHVGDTYTTGTFQVVGDNAQGKDQNFGDIFINTSDLQNPNRAKYVVLCESGHAVAIHDGTLNGQTANIWQNDPDVIGQPEPNAPPYNPAAETFANAYAAYYGGEGDKLKQASPEEYNAIATKAYQNGKKSPGIVDYIGGAINWFGENILSPLIGGIAGIFGGPGAQAAVNATLTGISWGASSLYAQRFGNGDGVVAQGPPISVDR